MAVDILSAKCLPRVRKYSFIKLQISFRSVTIRLLLHSFAICGLIFLLVNEHIVFKLSHSFVTELLLVLNNLLKYDSSAPEAIFL